MDFDKLNSATKYPHIPTYHKLGERGILQEEPIAFEGDVVLTEKVDGTNARIILMPDGDWCIGSREDLFTARGDRVYNTELRVVETLSPVAEKLGASNLSDIMVFFLEVYGKGTSAKSASSSTPRGTPSATACSTSRSSRRTCSTGSVSRSPPGASTVARRGRASSSSNAPPQLRASP